MSQNASQERLVSQRRKAAEEVCWKLLILMGIGELENVPMDLRPLVADPMQKWADLAKATGELGG